MIKFLLGGRTYDVYYIYEGRGILKNLADKLKALGPTAAVIREKPSVKGKSVHPKDWKKFVSKTTSLTTTRARTFCQTAAGKSWSVDDDVLDQKVTISEIKAGQIRVFFFEDEHGDHDPTRIILTHGYLKKSDDTPDAEVDRFLKLRRQYYTWILGD